MPKAKPKTAAKMPMKSKDMMMQPMPGMPMMKPAKKKAKKK